MKSNNPKIRNLRISHRYIKFVVLNYLMKSYRNSTIAIDTNDVYDHDSWNLF